MVLFNFYSKINSWPLSIQLYYKFIHIHIYRSQTF